jgi:hypothetical protein
MPATRIPGGGTRGSIFGEVARLRIHDAKCLFKEGRYNGAIYLGGYAVECQLKFAYCKRKTEMHLPRRLETHDWDTLVAAAGLSSDIKRQTQIDAVYSGLVDLWGPSLRYRTGRYSQQEANRLYNQFDSFISSLEN